MRHDGEARALYELRDLTLKAQEAGGQKVQCLKRIDDKRILVICPGNSIFSSISGHVFSRQAKTSHIVNLSNPTRNADEEGYSVVSKKDKV